jgi:hypothetical protein
MIVYDDIIRLFIDELIIILEYVFIYYIYNVRMSVYYDRVI